MKLVLEVRRCVSARAALLAAVGPAETARLNHISSRMKISLPSSCLPLAARCFIQTHTGRSIGNH